MAEGVSAGKGKPPLLFHGNAGGGSARVNGWVLAVLAMLGAKSACAWLRAAPVPRQEARR